VPRLEADGLVTSIPQRCMQIAPIDLNLVRNAFQLRLILEKEAVAHYCATVSDAELDRLAEDHRRIIDAARSEAITPALLAAAKAVD
jgi:DNA-binding GntR family transcriptional regulator